MERTSSDSELIGTWVRDGSEMAFRALVTRHVRLVFSAAFRQTGDPGLAEEITQNVFVDLARKAPRLARHETLAGWLHRAAILEAKARVRSELRRRRREDLAVAMGSIQVVPGSPWDDLTALLDEGLLHLRDVDRLALVLRYFEDCSLREVGVLLGVGEEAARKRVDRALERLGGFFKSRGVTVPAGAGAAVFHHAALSTPAVPAHLAAGASGAGLAAGAGVGSLPLFLIELMTLTKTKSVALVLGLAALPLGWQWREAVAARQMHDQLASQLAGEQPVLWQAEAEADRLQAALRRVRADTFNAAGRLADMEARLLAAPPTASPYQWDDTVPVARVPKDLIRRMPLYAVSNRQGSLTPEIQAALQLSADEIAALQPAIHRFLERYHDAQAAVMRRAEPGAEDLTAALPEDVRVFEFTGLNDTVADLRREFFSDLATVLDGERLELFTRSLQNWMPIDDAHRGINTGMAVFAGDHRVRFVNTTGHVDGGTGPYLGWGLTMEGSMLSATMQVSDIPAFLQPHLQDWIDQAWMDYEAALAQRDAGGGDSRVEPVPPPGNP